MRVKREEGQRWGRRRWGEQGQQEQHREQQQQQWQEERQQEGKKACSPGLLRIGPSSLKHLLVTSVAVVALLLVYRMHFSPLSFVLIALLAVGRHWSALVHGHRAQQVSGIAGKGWDGSQGEAQNRRSGNATVFLLINASFMIVEFSVSFLSNSCPPSLLLPAFSRIPLFPVPPHHQQSSLGLISDACHMLFDCATLTIGLYASYISRIDSPSIFAYGYGRFEVLSGFVNAVFLMLIAALIVFESIESTHSRILPTHRLLAGIFLHVLADTLGSVGVVISTLLIKYKCWMLTDPGSVGVVISTLLIKYKGWMLTDPLRSGLQANGRLFARPFPLNSASRLPFHSLPSLHTTTRRAPYSYQRSSSALSSLCCDVAPPLPLISPYLPLLSTPPPPGVLHIHISAHHQHCHPSAATLPLHSPLSPHISPFSPPHHHQACSIFISALIISTVIPLLQNSAEIILQRVPRAAEHQILAALKKIESMAGVVAVRQRHFWSFTPKMLVGSIHVLISLDSLKNRAKEGAAAAHHGDAYSEYGNKQRRLEAVQQLRQSLRRRVSDVFRAVRITHVTVECIFSCVMQIEEASTHQLHQRQLHHRHHHHPHHFHASPFHTPSHAFSPHAAQ
ncbi:unnamed protein product [Closterium sp. Naga37s-1]|nr:unnamed protein product [Closterium sp. Naga37s-1]